jgi:uncharacterized membrane protein YjjP (DUF1212 family)
MISQFLCLLFLFLDQIGHICFLFALLSFFAVLIVAFVVVSLGLKREDTSSTCFFLFACNVQCTYA